jgi:hypothetical protein
MLGLHSRLLREAGFRHAFFMRAGGVSPSPWASLNFSTASGDRAEAVAENLSRAAAELGVEPERVYFLSQVHGRDHRWLDGSESRDAVLREQGDITASRAPQIACAVRMADCAAVLLADRKSGAVAAVHSGWRGTVLGVAGAGLDVLRMPFPDAEVLAAIGPHIEACCFEVGSDVAEEIAASSSLGDAVVDRGRTKPHVDLRAVIEAQLRAAGVAHVDHVRGCTMCDSERFHSYRRDGAVSGRMLAAIVPAARA